MRKVYECPARYAPEVAAAIEEAIARVTRDQAEPGLVAPFMVQPTRTGMLCVLLVVPEIERTIVVADHPNVPQAHVA